MIAKGKVIFCTNGIYPCAVGGMQRHSRKLIETLADLGADLIVIHPHLEKTVFPGKPNIEEIAIQGIDVGKNYLIECFRYSRRVFKVLLQHPGFVIYSQGLSVWYQAGRFSDRLIVNPHGLEPFQPFGIKSRLLAIPFRLVFKHIFQRARYVVSLGGRLTDVLGKQIGREKIVVLPNAVDVPAIKERIFADSGEPVTCLFVARFAYNKGIFTFLRAIQALNESGYRKKFKFILVGDGPLHGEITKKYRIENVSFPGFLEDSALADHYRKADVFAFPTLFEGMPTVVLEAMAAQLPVIVSDTGATSELVDGSNGFLVKPGDWLGLKKALMYFSGLSQADKFRLAKASREKVESKFTWDIVARRHLELFSTMT